MAANPKTSLSAGIVIRSLLLASEAVSAITKKVFPVVTDKITLPYIYYRRLAMSTQQAKLSTGSDTVQIEVLCCADNYDDSLALAEAVRATLDTAQAEVDGLAMRSCVLTDCEEAWQDDAYVQQLIFNAKITPKTIDNE